MANLTLAELNDFAPEQFEAAMAGIFERSPWIGAAVSGLRPFASLAELHGAMGAAVAAAPRQAQLALLRAHPELAGREARSGALTADSAVEQRGAGLDRLTREQLDVLERGNAAYRARFGFPFIICVRNHDRDGIFAVLDARLGNRPDAEFAAALRETFEIARLRLESLLV